MKIANNLEPAHSIVLALGGCRPLARDVASVSKGAHRLSPSTISRWMRAVEGKGTGGRIPVKHWYVLLQVAEIRGNRGKVKRLLKQHTAIALGGD